MSSDDNNQFGGSQRKDETQRLIEALDDADPDVRYQMAQRLGLIGDKRAVEPLIALLSDQARVRNAHIFVCLLR